MTSEVQTLTSATHVAHLDVFTGLGLLVLPAARSDLYADGMTSLNAAGWDSMMRELKAHGWEPLEDDETALPVLAGQTPDGRPVVALYGLEPLQEEPSLEAMAQADASLRALVGLQRLPVVAL